MTKKDSNKLSTASVLAFERKLDPSDAIFSSGRWDERGREDKWAGVAVREKSVRGTISNRLKTKEQDPAKLDAKIQAPNLQTVDVVTLPDNSDTLRVRFTLRVLGGAGVPSACNNADYQKKLRETVNGYVGTHGFRELAMRYACNLASGRFLWRNRLSSEQVEVHVRQIKEGDAVIEWVFNGHDYSLRNFEKIDESDIKKLADVIRGGLAGDGYVLLEVTAYARMGNGQEVFPSQELILDKGSNKGGKSKTLYAVDEVAAMHSQKIGNALRTIDTWYPNSDDEGLGPIAVEPYGSVTSQGRAYRQPRDKMDFYTLLDGWVLRDKTPDPEQQHYVIANLIRGGVFGEKGE
ncbi:MAG: type I-F CRISPR-associated protein Csy3 [Candidatus Nitrospinota bacterium M3_3B_026]